MQLIKFMWWGLDLQRKFCSVNQLHNSTNLLIMMQPLELYRSSNSLGGIEGLVQLLVFCVVASRTITKLLYILPEGL